MKEMRERECMHGGGTWKCLCSDKEYSFTKPSTTCLMPHAANLLGFFFFLTFFLCFMFLFFVFWRKDPPCSWFSLFSLDIYSLAFAFFLDYRNGYMQFNYVYIYFVYVSCLKGKKVCGPCVMQLICTHLVSTRAFCKIILIIMIRG